MSAIVLGESLIDVIQDADGHELARNSGGSPLNVGIGLSRLGRITTLVTAIGNDSAAEQIINHCKNSKLQIDPRSIFPAATSLAHVFLDANGDASYNFELLSDFPAVPNSAEDYFTELGRKPLAVHFGSLGAHLNPGAKNVLEWIKLLHPHATICYDPNIRPIISKDNQKLKQEVTQYLEYVDVFKGNTEDIAEIFPGLSIDEAASEILDAGPSLVVISAGAEGLTMHTKAHRVEIPALNVTVVDTVGAGDSLSSALIDGLGRISLLGREDSKHINEMSRSMLTSLGYYAASAASITVARRGANPPTRAEISAQSELYLIQQL